MKRPLIMFILAFVAAVAAEAALPPPGTPGAPADSRYCGEPARDARGRILRDREVVEQFKRVWPHPQLPGPWYVDHVIPLERGGCDLQHNLQWLPGNLKTCRSICKDRWERKVYR